MNGAEQRTAAPNINMKIESSLLLLLVRNQPTQQTTNHNLPTAFLGAVLFLSFVRQQQPPSSFVSTPSSFLFTQYRHQAWLQCISRLLKVLVPSCCWVLTPAIISHAAGLKSRNGSRRRHSARTDNIYFQIVHCVRVCAFSARAASSTPY